MLTVDHLSAGYGKLVVLHDLSLVAESNRFTAILGANGSGKSTLLKSIVGLARIFQGSIRFEERELTELPTELISSLGIAYVPQRNNIFTAMTVRENLLLAARRLAKDDSGRALDEAYELFPILSKREKQPAGQLSGGERQMVAIAIGWLTRPRLMLLDEPSAGLSPLAASEVFRVLKALNEQNIAMVVVEQNARRVLNWCDDVLILREGQLVFEGSAETCLADEELVKSYLGVGGSRALRRVTDNGDQPG